MTTVERYLDAEASVADRVADLLARMTIAEKVAQPGSAWLVTLVADDRFDETAARSLPCRRRRCSDSQGPRCM
jgi:hypothetical protein